MPTSEDLVRDDLLPAGYWETKEDLRRDLILQLGGEERITPRRRILVEMIAQQYGYLLELEASLSKLESRIDTRGKTPRLVAGVEWQMKLAAQIHSMIGALGIVQSKEPRIRETAIAEAPADPANNAVADFIAEFEQAKKIARRADNAEDEGEPQKEGLAAAPITLDEANP